MMTKHAFFILRKPSTSIFSVYALIFLFLLSFPVKADQIVTNIGAIIDDRSHTGKTEKVAMKLAVQNFNDASRNQKLALQFGKPDSDPYAAAAAAEEMIKTKKVKVIVGMERWEGAALVADIGNKTQTPVISLTEQSIAASMSPIRWPFLIRMDNDDTEQIKCISALVHSHYWKRVIAVYEEDSLYNGDELGKITLLSEALKRVGSEIEYRMVLPSFSLLSDPQSVVRRELRKVMEFQSRVFIVLKSSLQMTTNLFKEARENGFMGKDSVWIVTDSVAEYLNSVNTSVISSMEGTLGIKKYYPEDTDAFRSFYSRFKRSFRTDYPEEDDFEPGIRAVRAYDAVGIISKAIEKMGGHLITENPKMLLNNSLLSNYSGLSGEMSFAENRLFQPSWLRVVNVIGKRYKELDFWLPEVGFSKFPTAPNLGDKDTKGEVKESQTGLSGLVIWPGDLTGRPPKGWRMPTDEEPIKIGVPKRTSFEKFVKFEPGSAEPSGFCIDLFDEILKTLNYHLPYKFLPNDVSYDDLLIGIQNKSYGAAVGDITILANRTEVVEFTQPYAESGLSMIVPAKPEESTWMFFKPFTLELWIATGFVFFYTMLIVWFFEHRSNPEFGGSWKTQFSNALWFAFSSLFFAHKEKINSNMSRVVVAVWLFVVFILTSSYTASLSSRLTAKQLVPDLDITTVREKNLTIGCDDDSFVKRYLMEVLDFDERQIRTFGREDNYLEEFETKRLSAAFLELPYERSFINQHCKKYTSTRHRYRFGGLGFAFAKGSPIAADFSKAILALSENGKLKDLEKLWFAPRGECAGDAIDLGATRLSLHSFWSLYTISIAGSTLCLLVFLIRLSCSRRRENTRVNASPRNKSILNKTISLARFIYTGDQQVIPQSGPTLLTEPHPHVQEWSKFVHH